MKEKTLKRFLSSIRGHIELGPSEVVEEKKNIDASLEKILKLTNAENGSLGDSNEASELHSLIQDLHRQYQSLYGHYDHFIGKLKKKVHHEGESIGGFLANFSSSDSESSDSESNEFHNHNEKANRTDEEKISIEDHQNLKAQLESSIIRNAELENEAVSMVSKIKEGENSATKLAEREAAYLAMEDEFNNLRGRNEILQVENEDLKRECNQQQSLTSKKLQSFKEEKEALLLEKSTALNRLEQADKYAEEFKVRVKQLEDEISKLQCENGSLKERLKNSEYELSNMKECIEGLQVGNGDLKEELEKSNQLQAFASERNEALLLEKSIILKKLEESDGHVERSKIKAEELKHEISKLQEENGVLKHELEGKIQEVDNLHQKLASVSEEKSALSLENSTLLGKIQLADEATRDLREESDLNLKLANERLAENERFASDNEKLKLGLDGAHQQIADLNQRSKIEAEEVKHEISKLQDQNGVLKHDIKAKIAEVEDLNQKLALANEEKSALSLENFTLLGKIQLADETTRHLKEESVLNLKLGNERLSENERLSSENEKLRLGLEGAHQQIADLTQRSEIEAEKLKHEASELQDENGILKHELEAKIQEVNDLSQKLALASVEKNALSSEKITLLGKVQLADETTKHLRDESEMNIKLANERLSENEMLLSENEKLKLELEGAHQPIAGLIQRVSTFEEDCSTLKSEMLGMTTKMQVSEKIIEELRSECEQLKDEKSRLLGINEDLNLELRVKNDEKASLSMEHSEVVDKLKQIQEDIDLLSEELQRSNAEKSELKVKHEGLRLELEGTNCVASDVRSQLQISQEEKSAIAAESSVLLGKTQEFEKMMDVLKTEREHFEHDNSLLKDKTDILVCKLASVEEQKNTLESEKLATLRKLEQAESSLKEILNEVEQLRREISLFQQNQLDSQHKISDLGRSLEERESDISSLQKNLEEASSQIQMMTVNAGNLQQELDLACTKTNELEEQVKTMTGLASEKQILMELEEDLRNEILTKEMLLKDQQSKLDELLANYRLLESQFQESGEKLEIAEKKSAEMESKDETIKLLQEVGQGQKLEMSKLAENLKELSEKLKFSESVRADLDKEILKLQGQVQTLEVQIRLSNQKLKITETENKEKEESYRKTMEVLQGERGKLEEHTSTLLSKINLMENDLSQARQVVKIEMETLGRAFNILESKLEGNCKHILAQVSWCTDDVGRMKQWINALVYAKEGLKNEKRDMTMRLNYKEGIISMLKDEAGILGSKLAAKAKEEERLVLKVTEMEKSMQVLEKRVKDKEEELFSKDEEKREAIRQLCLLIEYHRENCDYLFKVVSATMKGSKRTA